MSNTKNKFCFSKPSYKSLFTIKSLPLLNLLDVIFKVFSMTFQDFFKQPQDLLYQLKLECFTHFIQISVQQIKYKINKLIRAFRFTALLYQKYFNKKIIFLTFRNNERKLLPIPEFSRTTIQIQGLSRAWKFFQQIQDFQGPWQLSQK